MWSKGQASRTPIVYNTAGLVHLIYNIAHYSTPTQCLLPKLSTQNAFFSDLIVLGLEQG